MRSLLLGLRLCIISRPISHRICDGYSAKTGRLNGDARKKMARKYRRQATTHEFPLANSFSKCPNDRGLMIKRSPVLKGSFGLLGQVRRTPSLKVQASLAPETDEAWSWNLPCRRRSYNHEVSPETSYVLAWYAQVAVTTTDHVLKACEVDHATASDR